MGNTSSIREQITQVRTELSACRDRLGGFEAQEASLRRRSVGLFDQLMQDMEMVRGVMAEQQILAPFLPPLAMFCLWNEAILPYTDRL
jgi:hypothetical protein